MFYPLYLISHLHTQENTQKLNLGAFMPGRKVCRQLSKAQAAGNILIIICSPGLFNLTYSGLFCYPCVPPPLTS